MTDLASALARASRDYAAPIAQAYAAGNREYHVRIDRPGDPGVFDRTTGQWTGRARTTIYDGPARIMDDPDASPRDIGDETIPFNVVRVSLSPFNADTGSGAFAGPRADDVITVVDDPMSREGNIAGRRYEITGVGIGGFISTGWMVSAQGPAPSRHDPDAT